MGISVVNPVGEAVERTKLVLFKPFNLGKWFVLGFCAFLATLFEGCGGGGGGGNSGSSGGGGPGHWPPQEELDWLKANLELVITVGVIVLVSLIMLGALVTWLRCRGRFMFIDGIVHNRAAVVEPWKAFRILGNSLFWIAFGLDLLAMTLLLGAVAAGIAIAWPDVASGQFTSRGWMGIVIGGGTFLGFVILYTVFRTLLMDLVVPTMYLRNERVLRSCDIVYDELVIGHVGTLLLYLLMRLVLSIAVGVLAVVGTCATCCIAALPYLGTVILLPLYVFQFSYPLHFIEQYGPDWRIFPIAEPAPVAPPPPASW